MKKILTFMLALNIFISQSLLCIAQEVESPVIRSGIQYNENQKAPDKLFTGEVEKVKKGTVLKMTVSSVLSTTYTEKGDEFYAEITDDLNLKKGIVIPSGSVAHGTVNKVTNSKRLGRDASIRLDFDYIVTPNGRQIPIEASMTTKRNAVSSAAKVVLEDAAITVAGGVIGGILALKHLGLGAAVASNGYTLAGGAGVGALVGATASVARKGKQVLLAPGDQIKVKIVEELKLPVMAKEALQEEENILEGLKVFIKDYQLEKDPFGELNTITLQLDIDNSTEKSFSSFDMALVNDYKSVYYASPFQNTDLWFRKISPNSRLKGKLSFSVDNPRRKHWLVFYDNQTRKPLARISIDNAKKIIKKNKKKRKKRK